ATPLRRRSASLAECLPRLLEADREAPNSTPGVPRPLPRRPVRPQTPTIHRSYRATPPFAFGAFTFGGLLNRRWKSLCAVDCRWVAARIPGYRRIGVGSECPGRPPESLRANS